MLSWKGRSPVPVRAGGAGNGITITLWTQDPWLVITGHEFDGVPFEDFGPFYDFG